VPSHWVDGSVSIADGRVLATPVESESLYCLDLSDGRELWQAPRQEDLYVACADREKVVLVGCHTVRALRMADGKPLWEGLALKLPDDAMPSGRGFHADNRYYLPLSTAEVVAIDLDSGKIVNRAKSHNHLVPGNLVCYRDKLISQGIDGVETYYQLDAIRSEVKRRLAADPKDAEALSLQGETFLEDGKRSEAVASFRRSYELQSDPKTRELLLDALLDGLRLEFAAYQKSGDEVERLLDDSAKRVLYYRLMADGFRQEGQWVSALKYCEKVVDLEPNERVLDRIDENLSARRDRWVQGRLALLHNQIVGQVGNLSHGILDAAVQSRLKAAMDDRSIGPLQKFLDYFGDLPSTETARSELVRRLHKAGRLLEAELAASDSTASKSQPTSEEESWPVGKVEASVSPIKNVSLNGVTRNLIEIRGDRGPYFSESSLYFDSNRHILYANDGWGRQQWQVSLESDGPAQIFALNRAWSYAQAQNHLLLVALSWKIMAFDTSASGGNTTPRLLWTQNLMTSGDAPPETQAAIAWPMPNIQWQQRLGRGSSRLNLLGPVTNRYLCFQKLRTLDAVDPWSGKTLWSRSDIPAGSTIFGDHEHLFVLPPDRDDALLLRAIDGELLGTRKTPRPGNRQNMEEYCLTTFGRRMLLWWPEDSQQRLLTMVDPLEGRDLWPGRSFANNAHTSVAGDRAVGVMQLDGHFVMTSLPDGRTLADVMLEPEPRLIDITLMANGGKYYLLTRSATNQEDSPIHIQQIPGCDPTTPIEQGHLYAFDAQGKLLWPRPAVINRQFMLLNQPARLPVLSFASQLYEQNNDGSVQQFLSLMVIDKRNGRVAYKKAMTNSMGLIEVSGDAGKKTVDLTTQRETIRLTFTDQPLPPPAKDEYQPAQLPQESGKLNGFWKSLEKMMGNALDELGKGGR
jgi:outer membrane protein assembly factor BamB